MRNKWTKLKPIIVLKLNKKTIIKILIIIASVLLIRGLINASKNASQQLAFSDSFYKIVISEQMHNSSDNASLKDVLSFLLGFDITDSESIVQQYSPMLSEKFVPTPTNTPSPAPTQNTETKEETPLPIEESSSNGGMKISNTTNIPIDPDSLLSEPLTFSIEKKSEPQILIVHTHTTESFTDSNQNQYLPSDSDRSLEEEKNISAVGKKMAEVFNKAGICTIHDPTVHDYPSFNGAYTRSLSTVRTNLDKNPSIKIVLDVHRDGIVKEDGTKVKVVKDIDGKKTAQCMFVIGSNALLTHDNWKENFKLALKIQNLANEMYPGLMRPIILREERFNQQITTGSLIIEVGSNGNTLNEAILGGEKIAKVISALFSR